MSRVCFALLLFASALAAAPQKEQPAPPVKKNETFKPFTGKVAANKVRLRVKPDLESHILRQINKNDLLLIVGEDSDFYAVEAPKDAKAYVFRSYILDGRVEANRVNVRLEPHADAPIIGQLQAGDTVKGEICPMNHKWLEIPAPKSTRFYVSKEYVVHAGGPEFLAAMEKRKTQVEELLNAAFLLAETECKKSFEEMSPQPVIEKFHAILHNFSDFPASVATAKEALALLKETYLNKKIAYLESKAELSPTAKAELLAKHKAESAEFFTDAPVNIDQNLWTKRSKKQRGSLRVWDALEESLYLSWTAFHTGKKIDDFYSEQTANGSVLNGRIEPYVDPVKDRPGDYLLYNKDGQVAYLYSTQVDLNQYIGKDVTILGSPRPNNHFAFPAYFVLGVE
jgi:hypothetical protein